jgi:hypothetical protein
MPKIKRTYERVSWKPAPLSADEIPNRRATDYDVDKLVFWVCVLLFAIAFAWVR